MLPGGVNSDSFLLFAKVIVVLLLLENSRRDSNYVCSLCSLGCILLNGINVRTEP